MPGIGFRLKSGKSSMGWELQSCHILVGVHNLNTGNASGKERRRPNATIVSSFPALAAENKWGWYTR
jgi:hypothetical protein